MEDANNLIGFQSNFDNSTGKSSDERKNQEWSSTKSEEPKKQHQGSSLDTIQPEQIENLEAQNVTKSISASNVNIPESDCKENWHDSVATKSFHNTQDFENPADGASENENDPNSSLLKIKRGDSVKFNPQTESRGWIYGQICDENK